MRFRLRTLLILLALLPPIAAGGYQLWQSLRPKPPIDYTKGGYHYEVKVETVSPGWRMVKPVPTEPIPDSP